MSLSDFDRTVLVRRLILHHPDRHLALATIGFFAGFAFCAFSIYHQIMFAAIVFLVFFGGLYYYNNSWPPGHTLLEDNDD